MTTGNGIPRWHASLCTGCGLYLVRKGEACPHCYTVRLTKPVPPADGGKYGYAKGAT